MNAILFDLPDVANTHYGDQGTFDYIIEKHGLTDSSLKMLAVIVRGADTDRHDIGSQSSGLWAISAGLSYNMEDDQLLLEKGMLICDALYSWATHLQNENRPLHWFFQSKSFHPYFQEAHR